MTPAEKILWEHLRNRKFKGSKFRRQHPLSKFIADFFCAEHRLVIEVDGGYHLYQKKQDIAKEEALRAMGIRVIRFTNEQVESNIFLVLEQIEQHLG
jgi:very-short-patch-repair endonuclease